MDGETSNPYFNHFFALTSATQLYQGNTNKVAVLSHAGIWAWASPLQTGNFVPEGQTAPEGIPEGRM